MLANIGTKTLSEYSSCGFQVSKQKATYLMVKSENVKADIGKLGQCVVVNMFSIFYRYECLVLCV